MGGGLCPLHLAHCCRGGDNASITSRSDNPGGTHGKARGIASHLCPDSDVALASGTSLLHDIRHSNATNPSALLSVAATV